MHDSDPKTWLITGAGRGMGVELARAALVAGHRVVATGRDPGVVRAAVGERAEGRDIAVTVTEVRAAERVADGRG